MWLSHKILSDFQNDCNNSLDKTNKGVSACELDKKASWLRKGGTFINQDF